MNFLPSLILFPAAYKANICPWVTAEGNQMDWRPASCPSLFFLAEQRRWREMCSDVDGMWWLANFQLHSHISSSYVLLCCQFLSASQKSDYWHPPPGEGEFILATAEGHLFWRSGLIETFLRAHGWEDRSERAIPSAKSRRKLGIK